MDAAHAGSRPGKPLVGEHGVPPSKSLAQRALLAAALCPEPVWIARLGDGGEDLRRARELIAGLGARLEAPTPGALRVRGLAPGPSRGWRADQALELGESGTLARLATAAAGLCGQAGRAIELQAGGSLLRRSSPALFAALRRAGVGLRFLAREDAWPVEVRPIGPPSHLLLVAPTSSQELSALLLAAAAWPDPIEVEVQGAIPSRPYLEMTRRLLERFGVNIEAAVNAGGESFRVRGPLRASAQPILIEPDASAAAVLLAAACLSGGEISIAGLGADSLQGDVRVLEHLRAFGCRAGFDARGIFAGGKPTRGAQLDLAGEPDLAPVLAAVAACAALEHGARSQLLGLGTLQGKESARISVLAEGLAALGLTAIATPTSLEISPGRATRHALDLDPRGDHRMVFAFALLGLVREGVDVREPACVAKSWPNFWRDLAAAGATVEQSADAD